MSFGKNDITGAVSGFTGIYVWNAQGILKVIGGSTPPPPTPVVWGSITGIVTNQTDLITYLGLNFYPLSSNPAGYLTQTAANLLYYPLSSNPAGYITSAALTGYVPSTRTLTINGTTYDLSADRSWTIAAGGTVTSVGLSAPSAFTVSNSPVTSAGNLTFIGAGTTLQYIDGTGALQTFPTIPSFTPSALTKTNDTNVTLTLGGTPATSLLQAVSLTLGWTGTLATGRGGTGLSSIGTGLQYLRVNSGGTALEYATFPTIPTVTPSALTKTDDTNVTLTLGGTPATALLQSVSLTLGWTGTLADSRIASAATWNAKQNALSGTGIVKSTAGTITYISGTSAQYVAGDGSLVTFPTIPTVTPAALTKTDDTNVTLTLGGTPNTALLQATSLTLGWTGQLSTSRGGTGLSSIGTTGQLIRVNTGGTALEYFTPTYLTAVPNLQAVITAGSTLTQDNTISGGGFTQIFNTNYKFNIVAEQYIGLQATDGTINSYLDLYPQSGNTKWGYDDGVGNQTEIEMTGAKMYIRTPGYASAANGDVLTLVSNTSGEVEFQTPAGGGGILFGTASGTDTYTATITGATAYADGDAYVIKFTNGNTTTSTLNINSLGAVPLYRNNDGELIGGDIWNDSEMLCIYDATTTPVPVFRCIGTSPNSLFSYVTNDDTVTITKGQPVYASGGVGDRLKVKRAYNTSDATSAQTIGLVYSDSIATGQKGIIIMQGLLSNLSILPTSTWSDGSPVYLGATAGTITPTKQYAPNHLVYLGFVTTASNGNAGRLYVKPQNGYELDELHNVQAQSPADKDTLWFDNSVTPKQWKTASIATILGYTPQAQLNGTGFVKASGTTISYDNSTYTPTSRTLTINGTAYDLSADRSWTIASSGGAATIGTTIDGSGGTITVGLKGFVKIPYACTITGWTVMASTATAGQVITIDVWKSSSGIPTVSDTIINTGAGGVKPFLSSGQQLRNSASVTNWTTAVAANDYIGFYVDAATTVSWVILQIFVTKT